MNFTNMVAAAEARAWDQQHTGAALGQQAQKLATARLAQLAQVLTNQADAIRALPASLEITPARITIAVERAGRKLDLDVYFETELWKAFLVTWSVTTPASFDEGQGKASTADEAGQLLAEMIGRHLAGMRPTDRAR